MRYYDLLSLLVYLSVLLGVGAVAVSERRAVYLLLTGAACAAAWYSDRSRGAREHRQAEKSRAGASPVESPLSAGQAAWPVRALLAGGILAYALVDFLALGANEFVSLAHFLQFTLVVKLTSRKGPRDYRQILLMALFNLVVAAYIGVHVAFGLLLLAYVAAAGWALMLLVKNRATGMGSVRTSSTLTPADGTPEIRAGLSMNGSFGAPRGAPTVLGSFLDSSPRSKAAATGIPVRVSGAAYLAAIIALSGSW